MEERKSTLISLGLYLFRVVFLSDLDIAAFGLGQ